MSLKPLRDMVLLKDISDKRDKDSPLILVDSNSSKSFIADVIRIGDDVSCKVNVGDKVVYRSDSYNKPIFDGVEYIIVNQKDILAIVK